jgi:D-alanyl-lipoteichoic acid acyltransferase DltB (MBOAT superfamily)
LSYSIDVYRGKAKTEKHLGIFALYVSFFPQLVAGPIERSTHLLPQFIKKHNFDYQKCKDGILLMLWGFFQKVVIADRLAILVNQVYNHPTQYNGIALVVATIFFAFQIFCDFSGYSNIAIGAALVMGFDIMENFRQPYHAASVSEFWKRWHISLSSWFKDYLYIPLGGNRVAKWRWYYNIILVFLISGLWHGANWTFLLWGGLHGFYMLFGIVTQPTREKITNAVGLDKLPRHHKVLKVFTTFVLVCFAWIFFRANNISDAGFIISHLFTGWEIALEFEKLKFLVLSLGLNESQFIIAIVSICIMELVHFIQRQRGSIRSLLSAQPIFFRWAAYYGLIFGIALFGQLEAQEFIYFQF